MYYNTTNIKGERLANNKRKAVKQDQKILKFLREHPNIKFTWCEIHERADLRCPEVSTKRALNTLMNDCLINKCEEKKIGKYGRFVHTWELKTMRLF